MAVKIKSNTTRLKEQFSINRICSMKDCSDSFNIEIKNTSNYQAKILNELCGNSQSDLEQCIMLNSEDILFDVYYDYHFIDDFSMTKYFTKNEEGQIKFWGFDYARSFPISIRPILVAYCNDRDLLSSFCEEVYTNNKDGKNISIAHPIIKGNSYSVKIVANGLSISDVAESGTNAYCGKCSFKPINMPCFFESILDSFDKSDYLMSELILRQLMALYEMEKNLDKYKEILIKKDNLDENKTEDKLNQILLNKDRFLNGLGIGENLEFARSYDSVKRILFYVENELIGYLQAVNKWNEELKAELARKREIDEIRNRRQAEIAQRNNEMNAIYDAEDYYELDEDSYSNNRSGSSIGGFVRDVAAISIGTAIGNRGIKKELRKQREEERNREREREKQREREERDRRSEAAHASQREWERVRKVNEERRRKGQPELPLPYRFYS